MAEWWEADPVTQSAQSGAAADWWKKDPEVAASPKQQAEADVRAGKHPSFRQPSMLPAGVQRFSDAMTDPFGLQDEIVGAGRFIGELVASRGDLDKAGKAYTEGAERIRAERRVARQDYGIVPEIIGGLGTAGVSSAFKMAPTLAGRVGQSAKAGAGFGLATGVAQGEGGIPERVVSGAEGAATGAVLGPLVTEVAGTAIGGIARAARAGGRGLGNAVQAVRSRSANADQRMARALEDQNMSPAQALRRLDDVDTSSRFRQTQLDPEFTLADLGPSTRDLADTTALVSREARTNAGEFLGERGRGQFGRVNDYLRRSLQVTRDDFAGTQSRLVDEQRRLSSDAYRQAYDHPDEIDVGQVLFDRQFDDFAAAGPLRRALNRARSLFVEPSRAPGFQASLSTERFDSGKRALDDMIQSARQGGRNNEARLLTNMKNDLLNVVDQANPAYQAARDVYSSRAQLLDALENGRAFMRGDAEVTGAAYRALPTGEKRMFRIGVAREVRKALGGKTLSSDALGYFDKPNTRAVLEEIMSPAQARKFYELVELEQGLAATNQAVRGNSRTAERQQNILDFSLGVRLGRAIKTQGLRDALATEISDQITKFFAMREGDAVALSRALFDTNRANQRATLQRLGQIYGRTNMRGVVNRAQRLARRQIANRRRTLAGVAGEVGAEPQGQ